MSPRLLALFLTLGGMPAAAQLGPPPAYRDVSSVPIGKVLVIGGEPHRLWYFVTPDGVTTVARHFERHWRTQGYPVMVDGDFKRELVVSAFDTRLGLQHAVVLSRQGARTLGFNVIRDLWAGSVEKKPSSLPKLEGALFSGKWVDSRDEVDAPVRSGVLSQRLELASQQVQRALEREAYSRRSERTQVVEGRRRLMLEHVRAADVVWTMLVELEQDATAFLQVVAGNEVSP